MSFDFSGWATRNDLLCSDGRTIKKNAFKNQDGSTVPLVWNHGSSEKENILGHALLENRDDGVYSYCQFNDSESGQLAKKLVMHGDIRSLSILANKLKQIGGDVVGGIIREVSLVPAGANPGAYIDNIMEHSEFGEDSMVLSYDENLLIHSESKEEEKMNEETKESNSKEKKTIKEIFNNMTEEQQTAVYAMFYAVADDKNDEEDEEEKSDMKHNLFDAETETVDNTLSHADQIDIINLAKQNSVGSLKTAMEIFAEQNQVLSHGIDNIEQLFPEYKDVRPGAPEMLTTDQGWIGKVMAKVHKSPITRIRTRQADLRNIEKLRARGYKKGDKKSEVGNIKLIHRTTDPQTVYVKSKLDRDDIIDIQDFDVVQYMYNIDRMNLNEELATAIMIGDGREVGEDGKIQEDKIRPIWTDDELYTIHAIVDIEEMTKTLQGSDTSVHFGENYIYAESVIQTLLYAREKYKGTGTPDFYCTPRLVNVMLLARDANGRRIYDKITDLAAALNVGEIITAEQFAGRTRTKDDGNKVELLGMLVNLSDYSLGANKGGEITHFTDFDIDFNQEKSLLETRCSGALTRVQSAIALEVPVATD